MAQVEDWLLRQVRRFAEALAAVAKARDEDDPEAAHAAVEDGLRTLVGLSADVLARMGPDAVRPLVSRDEVLEVDRTLAVAELLAADADLVRDPGAAHARRLAATGLLALLVDEAEVDDVLRARLDVLARTVHLGAADDPTRARLLRHFEATDQFDRAEDVVIAWLDRDVDAAFEAGMALYERLWGLPEARLRAGGLTSDEILEGMGDLQRRARRR